MASPTNATNELLIQVEYYDPAEQAKLQKYPTATEISRIVGTPLRIPKAEFLTYYLFHRIKTGDARYADYRNIAARLDLSISAIEESVDLGAGTIRTRSGIAQQLIEVTDHIGEAVGLSVLGRIHGLSEADWRPVPEQRGRGARKTFDFEIASDGKHIVQVETKGSSVADNSKLCLAVKAQKRRIDDKKISLKNLPLGTDPHPAAYRYGTIAVIDADKQHLARCLLTDPPAQGQWDARRVRLMNRLRNWRDWIAFLSPKTPLAAALATRVRDLGELQNPKELDGFPLLKGNSKPYDDMEASEGAASFMKFKSKVVGAPAGGMVFPLNKERLFFFGLHGELIRLLLSQQFDALSEFRVPAHTISGTVDCMMSRGRFDDLPIEPPVPVQSTSMDRYVHFKLTGNIHFSSSGMVFAVLPLPIQGVEPTAI